MLYKLNSEVMAYELSRKVQELKKPPRPPKPQIEPKRYEKLGNIDFFFQNTVEGSGEGAEKTGSKRQLKFDIKRGECKRGRKRSKFEVPPSGKD